jgi:hypothetical protein
MPQSAAWKAVWTSIALFLFLTANAASAYAVPAFARKYQTSCSTCHIVFPKLNAFGEAFRLRGYRMPDETEDMVKQPPVSLGAPAYKKLWPKAIWPGEISSNVPLAVNIKLADVNTSTLNDDGTVTHVNNDLQFPQEANIFGAGTLGDHVSYLAEVTFGENPDSSVSVELEHARLQFDSPFGKEDLFHFRLGKFAPNVADGFQEMWISTDAGIDSLFAYNPIGVNGGTGLAEDMSPAPISFPTTVRGIEGYGIIAHRSGSQVSRTASGRARTAASMATTPRTSMRGSTTRSGAWGSTGTRGARPCPRRTGATTRCAPASSSIGATAATSTSRSPTLRSRPSRICTSCARAST